MERTLQTLAAICVLAAGNCAYGQFSMPKPETPLLGAAASGNTAAVKGLLKAGADPNQGRLIGVPAVMFPLMMQNREMFQVFVDANADLQVRDQAGTTTLMWAVYNEDADPAMIQQILKAGVDPNAKDSRGDTALLWAMRRGNATAARILEQAGASRDRQIRDTVEKSLALLQKSSPQFTRVSGCISCHNQVLPAMAMAIARERDIAVNEPEAAKDVEATIAMWRSIRDYMTMDAHKIPNPPINVSSDITATALSLRALQLYGNDAARVARAAEWLAAQEPRSTEDQAMQLLGLSWAKSNRALIEQQARKLMARQQSGGGWSQVDTPEADAYATGQALFALYTTGIVKPTDAAYVKAVDYLLRTQLTDGSWLVVSRSFPFQPYKESGFPHGKDQWISAAGTSWASMALSLAATSSGSDTASER